MKNLSRQIVDMEVLPGLRLLVLPTSVNKVVSLAGGFWGGRSSVPGQNILVASAAAELAQTGTKKRSRDEISDFLMESGASLSLSASATVTRINASFINKDLEGVTKLLTDVLSSPTFPGKEVSSYKSRTLNQIREMEESTGELAKIGLLRAIYPPGHPNYAETPDELSKNAKKIGRSDLCHFAKKLYGAGNMHLSLVGDIDPDVLSDCIKKNMNGLQRVKAPDTLKLEEKPAESVDVQKEVRNKASVDVAMGQAVHIKRDDPDYYPLLVGIAILGADFSARLMATVRDKMGLTYGIYAGLSGPMEGIDRYFGVRASFAPENYKRGVEATLNEINNVLARGVTAEELRFRKENMLGRFVVGMSDTQGLAGMLSMLAEEKLPLSFVEEYPNIISSITLDRVNNAMHKYIDSRKLAVSSAGTFPKS